jgi:hypothetical protein
MKYDLVLKKLENNEISSEEALAELYPVKKQRMGKKAYFVKMKITVPEEGKGVNRLLKFLFLVPFPMIFARIGLRIGGRFIKDDDIDISEISKMLKYSKNTVINVDSKDAQIEIKVI